MGLFIGNSMHAYDFKVDGLCYNILSTTNHTVELTYDDLNTWYNGNIVVPKVVSYNKVSYEVKVIGEYAFAHRDSGSSIPNHDLLSVTLPEGITEIGNCSFINCDSLKSVNIPKTTLRLGDSTFWGCKSLSSMDIPNGILSIDYGAFYDCSSLIKIDLSKTAMEVINNRVFNNCSHLEEILLPKSLKSIGARAFSGCTRLSQMIIPSSVNSIGVYAFSGCSSFEDIELPISISTINSGLFSGCKRLKNIKIPNSITTIGEKVFYGCDGLEKLIIPNSVTKVGNYAFNGLRNLIFLFLGNSINEIGRNAFQDCLCLQDLFCFADKIPTVNSYSFYGIDRGKTTLHVPESLLEEYKTNEQWMYFNILPLVNGIYNYPILSIKVSGYGTASFDDNILTNEQKQLAIAEGTNMSLSMNTDCDNRLISFQVNGLDVLSDIKDNHYNFIMTSDTKIKIEFEEHTIGGREYIDLGLPSGKYWAAKNNGAKLKDDKGGYCEYTDTWGQYWQLPTKEDFQELFDECEWFYDQTKGFVFKGQNGNIMYLPFKGFGIKESIGLGYYYIDYDTDKAYYWVSGYNNIIIGTESGFEPSTARNNWECSLRLISTIKNENVFSVGGINYTVISREERKVNIAKGNYENVLDVPSTVKYPDANWNVVGIDKNALVDCNNLSAIIWNPDVPFTENVNNPNLILYVKDASYAPTIINNVVVNGLASHITLTDAESSNSFYCPQAFTAQNISYTHHYTMMTGIGESRGWETIALPFDVQKIAHQSKGEIVPFISWTSGNAKKPFWLMEFSGNGWKAANSIKAYTPYVISMPNNDNYKSEFRLNGSVTFSSENVIVGKTENLNTAYYNGKTFVPNFDNQDGSGIYVLNVNNDFATYQGPNAEGSTFFINLRAMHPFEAYMTTSSTNAPESIGIFDDMATEIQEIPYDALTKVNSVYDLQGRKIEKSNLTKGVYIRNGQKVIIR